MCGLMELLMGQRIGRQWEAEGPPVKGHLNSNAPGAGAPGF